MSTEQHLYDRALDGRGAAFAGIAELEAFLDWLERRGTAGVQSLETFEFQSPDRQPLGIDLSIIGLDGAGDWENHRSVTASLALAREKIAVARASAASFNFILWIDDDLSPPP